MARNFVILIGHPLAFARSRVAATLMALAAGLVLTSCERSALVDPLDGPEVSPVEISTISPADGRLAVNWSPYQGDDFVGYDLYEVTNGERVLRFATDRVSTVDWIDSVFVGGMISYELVVRTTGKDVAASSRSYAGKSAALLDVEPTSTHRARLRWSPGDFGENVARFGVSRSRDGQETHLTEVLDPTDTSFVDLSAIFGESYAYRLISYTSEGTGAPSESIEFRVGGNGHGFQSLAYAQTTDSYYVLSQNVLRRIDALTHEVAAEYVGSDASEGWIKDFSVTPEHNRVYLAEETNVVQLDPVTLEVLKSVSLSDLLGYDAIPYNLSVGDEETALMNTLVYDSPSFYADALVLLDLNTGELRSRQADRTGVHDIALSSDGEYALIGRDIWRVNSDDVVLVAPRAVRADFSCVMDGGARYVTTDDGYISIFKTATRELEKRFPINTTLRWPAVDSESGYLGGYERRGHWYLVYDLATGMEVERVEVVPNQTYTLAKRMLFSSHGHYLTLDLE